MHPVRWATIWDTLWLLICDWHLLWSAMAYVIWTYKRFPECSPTCKKARVCAIMLMWLVHIKEHVWTIGTCPTTTLLSVMSEWVNKCYIERLNKKEVLPYMIWHAPQGVDLGGVVPPQEKWNDTVWKKWPEQENEKL